MDSTKITVNGQHYDSPEAMPPDVRRMYEDALRAVGPSLAKAGSGGNTQVFTGRAGDLGGSVIVNRTVTVNNQTYGSLDELPPEVRQQFEAALKGAASHVGPRASVHVSFHVGGSQGQTLGQAARPTPEAPVPFDSSDLASRIREIPVALAILIVIALIYWVLLGTGRF